MTRIVHAIVNRMPASVKDRLKSTWLYSLYRNVRLAAQARAEIADWNAKGRPVPPPHRWKQRVVQQYAQDYKMGVLIETGTFLGDMIDAMRGNFKRIYSIELDLQLFERAQGRFADCQDVTLLNGDSGKVISEVLSQLDRAALFWLDGHYSEGITAKGEKDTPIVNEIRAIFGQSKLPHVVLIDDARCFNGTGDYPSVSELLALVMNLKPTASFQVEDDIIRIV